MLGNSQRRQTPAEVTNINMYITSFTIRSPVTPVLPVVVVFYATKSYVCRKFQA